MADDHIVRGGVAGTSLLATAVAGVALGLVWLIVGGWTFAVGASATLLTVIVLAAAWIARTVQRLRRLECVAVRLAGGESGLRAGDDVDDGLGAVARSIDVLAAELERSEQRRQTAERLHRYESHHDELTGLPNRRGVSAALTERDAERGAAVLVVDVADLDGVARRAGHVVADEVVLAVAARLRVAVPNTVGGPILARWSPGRFVVAFGADRYGTDPSGEIARARVRIDELLSAPIETSAGFHRIRADVEATAARRGRTVAALVAVAESDRLAARSAAAAREVARSRAASN